ncbi:MAG: undecaprenyl-diphosphate phosphatase [Bacteroidetes bacterium]|nr:undecaprenyl-diphosphate phosphatase [Bacteroidota bacterium]
MDFIKAIILAVLEGLTEFLPISSTAHMIFASSYFGIQGDEFVKMFQVSIQFGAILAVVVLYWRKFISVSAWSLYVKLAVAVLPALILGKLFDDKIEAVLEKPIPISIVLIIGGIILLFIDRFFQKQPVEEEKDISITKGLIIGFWQCLAMMPGTSRAAASIIGGMQQGLTRKLAAEFSFFLAVPTMLAVTIYSVFLKDWKYLGKQQKGFEMILQGDNLMFFIAGNILAFVVAIIAIKFFIDLLKKFGFKIWGWYRIVLGLLFLIYFSIY